MHHIITLRYIRLGATLNQLNKCNTQRKVEKNQKHTRKWEVTRTDQENDILLLSSSVELVHILAFLVIKWGNKTVSIMKTWLDDNL